MCAAFLLIVAVVMYLLNLFTPWFCDDWHYPFIFGTHTQIGSLSDIIFSQCRHYLHFNGRFIVHCFVQLFAGLVGKGAFNVVNAVMFATFLYMIALATSRDKNNYIKIIPVAFVLLFFLMPGFKYVFLWLSGSCNYLWTGTVVLLFMWLMARDKLPSKYHVPLFVYGLISGWSNEAVSLGLGAALFLYFLMNRKLLTSHRKYLMIGFCLGLVALVFSPGALGRASKVGQGEFQVVARLLNFGNLRFFFLLLTFIVFKAVFKSRTFIPWVKKEQVLLMTVCITFVFIYLTGDYHDQSRFGIEMYSLLLLLRAIHWERLSHVLVSVASVATLAYAIHVVTVCAECDAANRKELSQITGSHCIVPTTQPIPITSFLHRYALDYAGFFVDDNKLAGEHIWISAYYGYDDVVFLPQIFIDDLKANYEAYQGRFRTIDKLPFFAMRLPESKDFNYATVYYREKPESSIIDALASKLHGEVDSYYADARVVTVNGEHYVFVARFHPSQDERLEKIVVEGPNDSLKYEF